MANDRPALPPLLTGLSLDDEPASDRLMTAIARTLALSKSQIQLFDSFTELGGNEEAAAKVEATCQSQGLDVDRKDVLGCQTLAELQTRVKPFSPISPRSRRSGVFGSVSEPDEVFSTVQPTAMESTSTYGSLVSPASVTPKSSPQPEIQETLESFLLDNCLVGRVCFIRPKAGPFEGQLLALLTLPDHASPDTPTTALATPDELESLRIQVRSIRIAAQDSGSNAPKPEVWVPLRSMALKSDGQPDIRRLQTWSQNINQDCYQQIMKLQITEPRRRQTNAHLRNSRVMSLAADLTPLWTDLEAEETWTDPEVTFAGHEYFPLSPMQQLFFETSMPEESQTRQYDVPDYRFSQGILLRIRGGAELVEVEAAVEAVVARHDMLRARFCVTAEGYSQAILPFASKSFRFHHHTAATDEHILALVDRAQAIINPVDGPVFAVELIRKANNEQLLYLAAHHLVVDLISWRVITHDLDELLQQGTLLSEGSISYRHWIDYQNFEMRQRRDRRVARLDAALEVAPVDLQYWDMDVSANRYEDTDHMGFFLDEDTSSTLVEVSQKVFRAEPTDVFLMALLLSFNQTFPERPPPDVWKHEHGREVSGPDFNIIDTVGWFTCLRQISNQFDPSLDMMQLLRVIKDSRRAMVRDKTSLSSHDLLDSSNESNCIPVEIMFNCIDSLPTIKRVGGILEPVPLPGHPTDILNSQVGDQVGRFAIFEVSVLMSDSGTRIVILYNKHIKHQERIALWGQTFERLIYEAINRLRRHEPELTLSDVPLLKTTYEDLSKLLSNRLVGRGLPSIQDIETIYPITSTQQEIILSQLQQPECFQVDGIYEMRTRNADLVDLKRLCAAWDTVITNEPFMRSVFIDSIAEEGVFMQVVLRKIAPSMLFVDSSQPEEALSRIPSLKTRGTEPKHRLSVCQTATKTVIRIDASQAICDLASVQNLVKKLCKAYSGGQLSQNHEIHQEYVDEISSIDTSSSLEVWKADLTAAKPCLFPRLSSTESLRQQAFDLEVTQEQVQIFSEHRRIDQSIVLQLAWAVVLRAYTGMDQVTFGQQFSGREGSGSSDVAGLVGSFATTLPCTLKVSSDMTVETRLHELAEAAHVRQHHNLTMADIQHALRTNDPVFNTSFCFEAAETFQNKAPKPSGLLYPCMVSLSRHTDCDISLTATYKNGRVHTNLNSSYLSRNQAQNLIGTFEQALKIIMDFPGLRIGDIDLFTDRDYAQIIVQDWEFPQRHRISACLHNLILQHVLKRPNAPAVCSWDGEITYGQMGTLVASLRTYLVNLGARPGLVVPLVLEKNQWAPVIMLAVMQAGACFIALDFQDKITVESTIRELRPQLVIATETAWRDLGTMVPNLVVVNSPFFATMAPQIASISQEATPEHAACLFLSPDRTRPGASKSIFFTHASLCSALFAQGWPLMINSDSRVLQLSAFNIDIALVEILGTLVHGGCVCIPSARERVENITGAITRMEATWTYMTNVLARRIDPSSVPSLRTLCFRTRKLDKDTYRPWQGDRNVLLVYGSPAVCPLGISVTRITKDRDLNMISPPFTGRFWILNQQDAQRLAPVGAIGELAIDAPIVMPYPCVPGEPLYAAEPYINSLERDLSQCVKTGHQARYLDNGRIEFVSSVRDEIMVDGWRVNVVEVEQYLRRTMGQGTDVVVDTITANDGTLLLAAFLELGDITFHGPEDLLNLSTAVKERAFIAKRLLEKSLEGPRPIPAHSIPSVYIPIRHFPISTSLKINRRKLQRMASSLSVSQLLDIAKVPNPVAVQHPALSRKPPPLTQIEEAMRAVWAGVLFISPTEIKGTSNFLSLGGDRYLVAEMAVECRKAGLQLSIADVLAGVSLTEICRPIPPSEVRRDSTSGARKGFNGISPDFIRDVASQMQIPQEEIVDIAEASPSQIRNLELGMLKNRADIFHLTFSFNSAVPHQRLESACAALARVHTVLRTGFAIQGHQVLQVLHNSFQPAFHRISSPPQILDSFAADIIQQDQDLQFRPEEPVTSFTFLDAGEQCKLIMRLDKAQVDASLVSILVQDLIALYEDPGTSITRPGFFEYMRAAESTKGAGIAFWRRHLQGAQMTEVVTYHKPPLPTSKIATVQETIQVRPADDFGLTFDTIIKAAWALVLATLAAQSDVVFGEVVTGYNILVPESLTLESLPGPMSNTIPIRVLFPPILSTPLDLMQYIQGNRVASRPYEALGLADTTRSCTDWPSWKRFSTVVQHRPQQTFDPATTLNMGSTTLTCQTIEPETQDIPDLLICSTMETSERVNIAIRFPEDRVNGVLAETALHLLVKAVLTMSSSDSMSHAAIPSAGEISQYQRRIPLEAPPDSEVHLPMDFFVPNDKRVALQTAITQAWNDVFGSSMSKIPEPDMPQTPFYKISSSLLSAHLLAAALNKSLPSLSMPGIASVHLDPETILAHPTMVSQFESILLTHHSASGLSVSTKRRSLHFRSSSDNLSWTPKSPGWKKNLRKPSMQALKMIRHRVSASWDGTGGSKEISEESIAEEEAIMSPMSFNRPRGVFASPSEVSPAGSQSRLSQQPGNRSQQSVDRP